MTNDVEETSIVNNNLSYNTASKVSKEGLPSLIDLYSKYDVESTFYFTGTFAKNFPDSVQKVIDNGHEVGCHGYSHHPHHAFDVLTPKEQYIHLLKAKKEIESISGRIEAFRAPALRLGTQTLTILENLGFRTDSSVASQRFDGPLTFGSLEKLKWLSSPRLPYFPNPKNPCQKGQSKILEIPVSALIVAYQGTTMRISPTFNNLLGNYLFHESKKTNKPIVFLYHPNEAITESPTSSKINRRSRSYIGYIFGDLLRHRLKNNNLGPKSLHLLEGIIKKSIDHGFDFVSAKKFRKKFTEDKSNYDI